MRRRVLLAAAAAAPVVAAHVGHFGRGGGTDVSVADIRAFDEYQLNYARRTVRECTAEVPRCAGGSGDLWARSRCLVKARGELRTERCRRGVVQLANVAKSAALAELRGADPTPTGPVDHGYIGGDDVPCVGDGCKGCNSTHDVKPYVWSYHIHFNWEENATYQAARQSADKFRDLLVKTFQPDIKDCAEYAFIDDLWNKVSVPAENVDLHQFAEMCEMPGPSGGKTYSPGGPFLMWNRGFVISAIGFHQIIPWLMANRPHDDLVKFFIHPNTGCQYNDLRHWSMWVGPSAVLDMRMMKGCVWAACEDAGCIGKDAGSHPDYDPAGYGACYASPATINNKCTITMSDSNTTTETCEHPPLPSPAPAPVTPAPPAPAPAPPAPPLPPLVPGAGPQAGDLYCGTVGGGVILNMNLTINPDGKSFHFVNDIVIAQMLVDCPNEPFDWQPGVGNFCDPTAKSTAGCGMMDITKAIARSGDCLVAGGKAEGGANHSFFYNGDQSRSIDSADTKFGTVTLTLTSLKQCDPHGNMPPPGPAPGPPGPSPPAPSGQTYQCENSCSPTNCFTCVASATGSSQADCEASCGNYNCAGGKCVQTSIGGQSKASCEASCGAPSPPAPAPPAPTPPAPASSYACVNSKCAATSVGGLPKAQCEAQCGAFACVNSQCVATSVGGLPKAQCEDSCGAFACVGGTCQPTSVGGISKSACAAKCGAGPAPPAPAPPAPAPPAPATGGPQAGSLFCGSVGGGIILTTNLTIGADGTSMDYYNHIVVASTLIACKAEKYEWKASEGCDPTVKGKAGCGTLDITKTTSDPNDCLAKGGAAEGGAVHTFIYNGPEAATVSAKDSKYGTVEMKLSSNGKC